MEKCMSKLYAFQVVGDGLVLLNEVGGEHPSHGLPGFPPHVGNRPPGSWPGHPDQGLPGGGSGIPDNTLPSVPPPQLLPGYTLAMVRTADMKWHYAAIAPGTPVQPLPEPIPPGGAPDQGLPPQPPVATQPPMPGQLPSGPPTAAPKR
jgi:hypothetical protein